MMYIILLPNLPWVPEPQNLNERKLVRGKERRKKGKLSFLPYFFFLLFFGSGTHGTPNPAFPAEFRRHTFLSAMIVLILYYFAARLNMRHNYKVKKDGFSPGSKCHDAKNSK